MPPIVRVALGIPLLLLTLAPAPVRADSIAEDVNAAAFPSFVQWGLGIPSVGWYFTPTNSLEVAGVLTNFRELFQPGDEDRTVTVEILTDRRAVGGTLIASVAQEGLIRKVDPDRVAGASRT